MPYAPPLVLTECTCPVAYCGRPATITYAQYRGEGRMGPPPPQATHALGWTLWWYLCTCSGGYHKTLLSQAEYLELV